MESNLKLLFQRINVMAHIIKALNLAAQMPPADITPPSLSEDVSLW